MKRFFIKIRGGKVLWEWWITDQTTGKVYRYDNLPPNLMVAFIDDYMDANNAYANKVIALYARKAAARKQAKKERQD